MYPRGGVRTYARVFRVRDQGAWCVCVVHAQVSGGVRVGAGAWCKCTM